MNQDLIDKYHSDDGFKRQVDSRKKQADELRSQASQLELALIPPNIICSLPNKSKEIYFYFGYQQPLAKRHMRKLAMFLLSKFRPNPEKSYRIVFFNNLCQDNYVLWNFRETLTFLPIQILSSLEELIVVKPYFYHKAMDFMTFGTLPKYLKSRSLFLGSIEKLSNHLSIPIDTILSLVPSCIVKQQFPHLLLKDISLMSSSTSTETKDPLRNVRKSMIMKPSLSKNSLEDYDLCEIGIPLVLKMFTYYFETYPASIELEGLFRKSVSIDEQNQTIQQVVEKNYDYLLQVKDPHIIANLIKRFLSSLQNPIIPFTSYKILMSKKPTVEFLAQTIAALPKLNFLTLMFLINFLTQKILPAESKNKMTVHNMGVCFAPCLMWAEKPSPADLLLAPKVVEYTQLLITGSSIIFGNEQERKAKFEQSFKQNEKEFEKSISLIYDHQQGNEEQTSQKFYEELDNQNLAFKRTSSRYSCEIHEDFIENKGKQPWQMELPYESKKMKQQVNEEGLKAMLKSKIELSRHSQIFDEDEEDENDCRGYDY